MDYSHGKIYFLRSTLDPRVYIGSTIQSRKVRQANHRTEARKGVTTTPLYNTMRLLGVDTFVLEIVEEWPCSSRKELEEREFQWIQATPTNLLYNVALEFRRMSEDERIRRKESWTDEMRVAQAEKCRVFCQTEEFRKQVAQHNATYWTDANRAKQSEAQKASWTPDRIKYWSGVYHPGFKGGYLGERVDKNMFRVSWKPLPTTDVPKPKQCEKTFSYAPNSIRRWNREQALEQATMFKKSLFPSLITY